MLAVLSGGGTAGHINPALALADELVSRGWDVRFAGTPGGVESRLVPAAGIPFTAFEASGFDRSHPASLAKGVAKIAASTGKAKKWFADIKPDVVVGFGGYVCIPVARAAEKTGVPVVLHEQNSVAGMANKYLARRADAVCVTYECSAESLGATAPVTASSSLGPVMCTMCRFGRASSSSFRATTASLMWRAPKDPPKTSSMKSSSARSNIARPAARSASMTERRTGLPVTVTGAAAPRLSAEHS